jgi:hypothetical protein
MFNKLNRLDTWSIFCPHSSCLADNVLSSIYSTNWVSDKRQHWFGAIEDVVGDGYVIASRIPFLVFSESSICWRKIVVLDLQRRTH